jgi:hypothetical protein
VANAGALASRPAMAAETIFIVCDMNANPPKLQRGFRVQSAGSSPPISGGCCTCDNRDTKNG